MELNIEIKKFGPENKEIVKQINKWQGYNDFSETLRKYFAKLNTNRSAFAYFCEKEVVAFAFVEQSFNEEYNQSQCTIKDIVVNPNATNSRIEDFVVNSICYNKNKILSKKTPTLFFGFANVENKALIEAYVNNNFHDAEQVTTSLTFVLNNQKFSEKERE